MILLFFFVQISHGTININSFSHAVEELHVCGPFGVSDLLIGKLPKPGTTG